MARQNIHIHVDFTTQRLRCIKLILENTLSGKFDKKSIVYTNTRSCLEQMQADVELWLDMNENIKGDAIVIYGDLKPKVKFVSAERFTKVNENPEELINTNIFYSRVLLATAGSTGATFINNPSGLITPDILIQKITEYPYVGKNIYNRPQSVKSPPIKFVNVTVLQLIASGLIRIEVNEEESKCYCRLVVNNLCPAYLNESIWDSMFLIKEQIN